MLMFMTNKSTGALIYYYYYYYNWWTVKLTKLDLMDLEGDNRNVLHASKFRL